MKRYISRLVYSEGVTPLPYAIVFVLVSVLFVNAMTITMCISYLPKMVKSFGVSEVQTGHYVGLIASSIFFGTVPGSLLWGHFADTRGHKLALLLTTTGMLVTILLFGFTSSITWALMSRLAQGMFCGIITVSKSALSHALDETNTALGFSIFFTAWTISLFVGPTVAGYLVFPAEQYPTLFSKDSFFGRFGVMLPNLFLVACDSILIVLIIVLLPNDNIKDDQQLQETQILLGEPKEMNYKEECIISQSSGRYNDNASFVECITITNSYDSMTARYGSIKGCTVSRITTSTENLSTSINELLLSSNRHPKNNSVDINEKRKTCLTSRLSAKLMKYAPSVVLKTLTLFKSKDFTICLVTYAFLAFTLIGMEDMFAVFAATSTQYNGLQLSTSQIGTVFLAASFGLLIIQITVTSKISRRFGARRTFIACLLFLMLTAPLIPTVRAVREKSHMIVATAFILFLNQVFINSTILNINILINKSVTPDMLVLVNGLAMTFASLGRLGSPAFFGTVYSWSLTNIKNVSGNEGAMGYPFNQFFIFLIASLCFFLTSIMATRLSAGLKTTAVRVEKHKSKRKTEIVSDRVSVNNFSKYSS